MKKERYGFMTNLILLLSTVSVVSTVTDNVNLDLKTLHSDTSKQDVLVKHGAVTSDVRLCSEIGIEQMKKGGSAVDAIIATIFCRGVVNSAHSGIGGGGFMLVYDPNTNVTKAIDFRESLPSNGHDPFLNQGRSVGVPGEVKGLYLAHQLYGRLKWDDLIEPAIYLAENGFPITEATVSALKKKFRSPKNLLKNHPNLAQVFLKPSSFRLGGKAQFADVRDIATNAPLGRVLRAIAKYGPKAFYTGPVAEEIIRNVVGAGGSMTREDLYYYEPVLRKPYTFTFWKDRFKIISFPPPSSGPLLATTFKLLERLGLPDIIQNSHHTNPYLDKAFYEGTNCTSTDRSHLSNRQTWILSVDCDCHGNGSRSNPINYDLELGDLRSNDHAKVSDSKLYPHDRKAVGEQISMKNQQGTFNPIFYKRYLEYGINSGGILMAKTPGHQLFKLFPLKEMSRLRSYGTDPYFKNVPDLDFRAVSLYYHWLIETFKFAQSYGPFMGDPGINYDSQYFPPTSRYRTKFLNVPNASHTPEEDVRSFSRFSNSDRQGDLIEGMFKTGSLDGMVAAISNDKAYARNTNHYIPPNIPGTAHASAIDNEGLIVSCTTSLNNLFGSKIMTESGILLNDHMIDFSNDITFNNPESNKRPHSSMVPTIVYDTLSNCGLQVAIGGSNGSRIISGVAQVLMNLIAFGDSLEEAMERPRVFPNHETDVVEIEENLPEVIIKELIRKNHKISKVTGLNSVIPIIKYKNVLSATSDSRKSPIQSAAIF